VTLAPDSRRSATPAAGRAHFGALQARLAARVPERLTYEQAVEWLNSLAGRHVEVSVSTFFAGAAAFTLRGPLGRGVASETEKLGACTRFPVGDRDRTPNGSVLFASRALQQTKRTYAAGCPRLDIDMVFTSPDGGAFSTMFVTLLADRGGER
jgi:hypothetical protein